MLIKNTHELTTCYNDANKQIADTVRCFFFKF